MRRTKLIKISINFNNTSIADKSYASGKNKTKKRLKHSGNVISLIAESTKLMGRYPPAPPPSRS